MARNTRSRRAIGATLAILLLSTAFFGMYVAPGAAAERPFKIPGDPSAPDWRARRGSAPEAEAGVSAVVPLATDDDIPGVAISASPVVGAVDAVSDIDDVYAITLIAGDTLSLTLTGAGGTDFDLYLFGPDATSVWTDAPVDLSYGSTYPESLSYTVPAGEGGTYYIDIGAWSGSGSYTMSYTVTAGTPPEPDDDIEGVPIPASPIEGTLADGTDDMDVYSIDLAEGDTIVASLVGDGGTDFDIALFDQYAVSVWVDDPVAASVLVDYPDVLTYTVHIGRAGTYYLAVGAYEGSGAYTVTYTVTPGTPTVGPEGYPVANPDGSDLPAETAFASPTLTENDWFGDAVAVSDDTLIVGKPTTADSKAYVSRFDGSSWSALEALPGAASATSLLGSSVDIDGDYMVAGAPYESQVYTWHKVGDVWGAVSPVNAPGIDLLGRDVAISGDTMVAGGYGYVVIYRLDAGNWTLEQVINGGTDFGFSVDIDGDRIAVGDAGGVSLYTRSGTTWTFEESMSDAADPSVALEGETLVVGTGTEGLGVEIYERTGAYGWVLMDVLYPTSDVDETAGDFGSSVAISGDRLVVGAPGDYETADGNGAVYLYFNDAELGWRQVEKWVPSSFALGTDVALSPDWVAGGAPLDSDGGSAYTWALDRAYEAPAGHTLRVDAPGLLTNDTGQGLEAELYSDATFGFVQLWPDGHFTYTQTAEHLGSDEFTYRLWNGYIYSDPTTVTIEAVAPVYDPTTLAGSTRFDTAVEVSKETFPLGANTVLIATGRNWPDALGGSSLAGAVNGPILLTDTTYIPDAVCDEILRLGASEAIILGGVGAVSVDVEAQLYDLGMGSVIRLAGVNRYQTAEIIAEEAMWRLGPAWDGTVIVATGRGFADALAGSPVAAYAGWPIYLADPVASPSTLVNKLQDVGADYAVVLGGEGAVSAAYFSALDNGLGGAVRLAGSTRYATAVTIAGFGVNQLGMSWDGLGMAVGTRFPDGLTGGVLCGEQGSVMLLTDGTVLSQETGAALSSNADDILEVNYFGGIGAVTPGVRASIADILEK